MWDVRSSLWYAGSLVVHEGFRSLTRNGTRASQSISCWTSREISRELINSLILYIFFSVFIEI